MGETLYRLHAVFRNTVDECSELLRPEIGHDLRALLYPQGDEGTEATSARLDQTQFTQPLLFTMAMGLSRLWQSWGIVPAALLGHSIGEYAAACVSGVVGLEDALRLVARRGRMMGDLPPGAMLSVRLAVEDLLPLLEDELDVAAVNGPQLCVASGTFAAIERLQRLLAARQVQCTVLRTSHAFHSSMMDPILPAFQAEVAKVRLSPPRIPILSTATADWLDADTATDPAYWSRQLRMPVRFSDSVQALWKTGDYVTLELGPRAAATTLARRLLSDREKQLAVPSMGEGVETEQAMLLGAVGQLWACGAGVDLGAVVPKGRPVTLPPYPFERRRHWIEPAASQPAAGGELKVLLEAQMAVLRAQVHLLQRQVSGNPVEEATGK
jgi:acyl transferase domain-containing protein